MFSGCLGEAADACTCYGAACFCSSDLPSSGSSNSSAICRQQFRAATASMFANTHFTNHESLPSLLDSFTELIKFYPRYSETDMVDRIRDEEYYHLNKSKSVCLDYNGIGLFSYSQVHDQESVAKESSSSLLSTSNRLVMPIFNISYRSVSLKMELLHGGKKSEIEFAIKRRIMDYLTILDDEYSMVFTANRATAFKLLAESYPYQSSRKLLTVYDYKSEAVEDMVSTSRKRGAKIVATQFVWPRLKICTSKLKKEMANKNRKKRHKGLFAFPLQSRVTGSTYPCLWMNIARENGWHVLFDACALGPNEMKSFGISLNQPDFIICSFYKVFGYDPSGFGCLFVKKSTISILEASTTSSIVNLVPPPNTEFQSTSECAFQEDDSDTSRSFSGPILSSRSQSGKLEQGDKSNTNTKKIEDSKQKGLLHTADILEVEKKPVFVGEGGTSCSNKETTSFNCRGLDHVHTLGLRMIGSRARYLINWLVIALQTLHHL